MRTVTQPALQSLLEKSPMRDLYLEPWSGDGWSSRPLPGDNALGNRFLADRVSDLFSASGGEILLEVTGSSIFPSSDNRKIFLGYLRLLGEARPLMETRTYLFAASEIEDVRNLFNLGLMFLYDIKLMNLKTGSRIFISHHAYMDFKLHEASWQVAFENWSDGETPYWPDEE